MQLRKLQSSLKEIEAAGGRVVVVSYDAVDTLKRVAAKREVTFLLLSDPGSKTISAFGILNKEGKEKGKGLPVFSFSTRRELSGRSLSIKVMRKGPKLPM